MVRSVETGSVQTADWERVSRQLKVGELSSPIGDQSRDFTVKLCRQWSEFSLAGSVRSGVDAKASGRPCRRHYGRTGAAILRLQCTGSQERRKPPQRADANDELRWSLAPKDLSARTW